MSCSIRLALLGLAAAVVHAASPVEFGVEELERAIAERNLRPGAIRYRAELNTDAPESFRIEAGRISGGDLRGLMYGLLEAAEQVRRTGRLTAMRGAPSTKIRGIRTFLHNEALEEDWYFSREYWRQYFAMLARNRFKPFQPGLRAPDQLPGAAVSVLGHRAGAPGGPRPGAQ